MPKTLPSHYWIIEQYTGTHDGWETVTAEDTLTGARNRLAEYRDNQPDYPARMRYVRAMDSTLEGSDL